MYRYEIRYYYGSYNGTRIIYADDDEQAIAQMWRELRPHMSLGMASQGQEIIRRDLVPTPTDQEDTMSQKVIRRELVPCHGGGNENEQ